MPHVMIKLGAGRSDAHKAEIAVAVAQAMVASVPCDESRVSLAIEDVEPADWVEQVYKPDILGAGHRVYKKPGYDPL